MKSGGDQQPLHIHGLPTAATASQYSSHTRLVVDCGYQEIGRVFHVARGERDILESGISLVFCALLCPYNEY